jgi:hypothetical protein
VLEFLFVGWDGPEGWFGGWYVDNVSATLTISGDDPRQAGSPLFANFLAVSHVGTDVQFEFIFLDFNQLALTIERFKAGHATTEPLQGKTVGKMIIPVSTFLQVKDHLLLMFNKLEALDAQQGKEASGERKYGN